MDVVRLLVVAATVLCIEARLEVALLTGIPCVTPEHEHHALFVLVEQVHLCGTHGLCALNKLAHH